MTSCSGYNPWASANRWEIVDDTTDYCLVGQEVAATQLYNLTIFGVKYLNRRQMQLYITYVIGRYLLQN